MSRKDELLSIETSFLLCLSLLYSFFLCLLSKRSLETQNPILKALYLYINHHAKKPEIYTSNSNPTSICISYSHSTTTTTPFFFSLLKQGAVQEKEEYKSDVVTSQDPSVQEWLAQAQTTRSQQQLSIIQRQKVSMIYT